MSEIQQATLGGGCFWCLEAIFEQQPGVLSVVSGYAGGQTTHPSYEDVCTGETGHAEVVQVTFHPERISFDDLLEIFWKCHDPTTLNQQGADIGTQYRSVIFFHTPEQQAQAEQSKAQAASRFDRPIVTEVASLPEFFPAETYHQGYYRRNPRAGYCSFVIRPKLQKLGLNY